MCRIRAGEGVPPPSAYNRGEGGIGVVGRGTIESGEVEYCAFKIRNSMDEESVRNVASRGTLGAAVALRAEVQLDDIGLRGNTSLTGAKPRRISTGSTPPIPFKPALEATFLCAEFPPADLVSVCVGAPTALGVLSSGNTPRA